MHFSRPLTLGFLLGLFLPSREIGFGWVPQYNVLDRKVYVCNLWVCISLGTVVITSFLLKGVHDFQIVKNYCSKTWLFYSRINSKSFLTKIPCVFQ